MTEYKTCSKCKQIKSHDEFGIHRNKPDGRYSQCFICHRLARAEYRKRNVESIKKQQKDNYERNKEKRIAYATKRVYENLERHKNYQKISKKRNHVSIAANTRRRNAKKRNNGIYTVTKKELKKLLLLPCFYCGSKQDQTIDHVVAIARGGTDSIGNLVTACKSFNSRKRQLTIMEWRIRQMRTP